MATESPETQQASGVLTRRKATARSKVTNGAELLPGIDGRSPMARRYRDLLAALASDQGGLSRLSEARVQLCRRFAALSVLAESMEADLVSGKAIKIEEYALMASTLVRVATRIGIDRRATKVVPHLRDYLEGKAEVVEDEDAN